MPLARYFASARCVSFYFSIAGDMLYFDMIFLRYISSSFLLFSFFMPFSYAVTYYLLMRYFLLL